MRQQAPKDQTRGDTRADGKIFWGYWRGRLSAKVPPIWKERWVTPEDFSRLSVALVKSREKLKAYQQTEAYKIRERARGVILRKKNAGRYNEYWRKYYRDHREKARENRKKWSIEHPERVKELRAKYKADPEAARKRKEYFKRYREDNREWISAKQRAYRAPRRAKFVADQKAYSQTPEGKAKAKAWFLHKMETDPHFATRLRLLTLLRSFIERNRLTPPKSFTAEMKRSALFLVWLLKRNHGGKLEGLDIDHIYPISKWRECPYFENLHGPENLRWLDSHTNRFIKADKLPSDDEVKEHLKLVAEWEATLG